MRQLISEAFLSLLLLVFASDHIHAQTHPEIYITNGQKQDLLNRIERSEKVSKFIDELKHELDPYVDRHQNNPEWIVSRLQMYWKTKYTKVFVNGMDFSHGEGTAPVPTVRFSGSRDWATDYLRPKLENVKPYMDDERGLYLQNKKKDGRPWEWVKPSETGHIIEGINRQILNLAEDAAFIYWLTQDEKYAVFAYDIFMPYIKGMYHREPPQTVGNHKNAKLMGLQTFEVIHEGIIEPVTVCYDFLYPYLKDNGADLKMIQEVFRKWADQEIKYGVPNNNWNLMQARFITYLAIALEDDTSYEDGKGQQYYIDQVLNQNSEKQKALKDVVKNYDPATAIWPEVAGYSTGVTDDILEIFSLMDKTLNNNLLEQYPTIEKAVFASFNYLFPNGLTTAYGDAKHQRLRFNSLELLISHYRKHRQSDKEDVITGQLKRFIQDDAYSRNKINSLFRLFLYVEELKDVPAASSFAEVVNPTFYSPNVSWVVQRNGNSVENGMMISKNASLGNHSHTNGVNIELFAKGMVIAPDSAAGASYWTTDHSEYYSRFAAHNTVVVDGVSDYRNMRGSHAFTLNSVYPATASPTPLFSDYTVSDVTFIEPKTDATQHRITGTVRTGDASGYFIDIFRSARKDGKDKKHEYLFHSQGEPIVLSDFAGNTIATQESNELSSAKGDLVGYDYFKKKHAAQTDNHFIARFSMPSVLGNQLNLNLWMQGNQGRQIFAVEAPYSRAISRGSVPRELYQKPLPTLVVRQPGQARTKPFVAILDAYNQVDGPSVTFVGYFSPVKTNPGFVGIKIKSNQDRQDIIYNDENPDTHNQFKGDAFQGRYGVVTMEGKVIRSILLHCGSLFEQGLLKIEIPEGTGDVLIKRIPGGYAIDTQQAFKLTIPIKMDSIGELKTANQKEEKIYKGKVTQSGRARMAIFELPALHRVELTLN
ncbi:hypothetical protein ACFL6U_18190 [Planctomycetota bacterium]